MSETGNEGEAEAEGFFLSRQPIVPESDG